MEECAEVAKEASKALRFGLHDSNPNDSEQPGSTNSQKITREIEDLYGVIGMLHDECGINVPTLKGIDAKRVKINKFLNYSKSVGKLKD